MLCVSSFTSAVPVYSRRESDNLTHRTRMFCRKIDNGENRSGIELTSKTHSSKINMYRRIFPFLFLWSLIGGNFCETRNHSCCVWIIASVQLTESMTDNFLQWPIKKTGRFHHIAPALPHGTEYIFIGRNPWNFYLIFFCLLVFQLQAMWSRIVSKSYCLQCCVWKMTLGSAAEPLLHSK